MTTSVCIIGHGRAGGSLGRALRACPAPYDVSFLGRGDAVDDATTADLVVIATPDSSIERVASALRPNEDCVVFHLAGSLGLGVLTSHPRRAALHPLVSLPSPEIGSQRLVGGWFAVAGDQAATQVARDLDGKTFTIDDEQRALYHATAAVAANHLVALFGQVERLAAQAGAPLEAFLALAQGALDSVAEVGPAAALTGPAARGDDETLRRHLAALPPSELAAYEALLLEARKLVQ